MKLRIQKRLLTSYIINEDDTILATISNKRFLSISKKICDSKGNIIFTTDIVNLSEDKSTYDHSHNNYRKYIIYKGLNPFATADIHFFENYLTANKRFTLRPPKAYKMNVTTPHGIWDIRRNVDNSLTVTFDGNLLGNISSFFSIKPIILDVSEKYTVSFWAAIYVLIEYMMHEDDLIMV